MSSRSSVSFACIKYRCRKSNDRAKFTYIRIYKQIPHFGTETDCQAIHARQATTWIPPELTAYKEMTDKNSNVTPRLLGWRREQQDRSGLILLVSLAWEEVAGIQLGNQFGSEAFWQLNQYQRQKVRKALQVTLCFMVGFCEWVSAKPTPWTESKIAEFGLAKIPETCDWWDREWDGDTFGWEW